MSLQQVQDKAFALINGVDSELGNYPSLKKIESQIGLPKAYLFLGGLGVYLFMIFLNIGGIGQLLANFAALVVPGYYSLQALETRGTDDDTMYLTYWVVYACFSVLEFWSRAILYWIPLYWLIKTAFFLYLGLPQFGGARHVYVHVIRPFTIKFITPHGGSSSSLKEKVDSAMDADSASVATGVDL